MTTPQTIWTREQYAEAARQYCESLPLEHFMEATTQSMQADISVASLTVYRARRGGGVFLYSELLIQYFFEGNLRQVVPDNMLVIGDPVEKERGSWDLEYEMTPIFLCLEYVSKNNRRKDYVDSYTKYERELLIPYYLTVDHDRHDLRLHHLEEDGYVRVQPNDQGRFPIPELELEVGWQGNWARFWFRGQLLPITAELEKQTRELEEEIRRQDRLLKEREERLKEASEQVSEQARQIEERDRQLEERDARIEKQGQQLSLLVQALRPVVEEKARQAGRQDILEQLTTTTDAAALGRWLSELVSSS